MTLGGHSVCLLAEAAKHQIARRSSRRKAVMPLLQRMPEAVKTWSTWLSKGPPSGGPELPGAIKHIPKDGSPDP